MTSINWKAKQMPIVFWSESIATWQGDPRTAECMSAEVMLPNGVVVVVDNVRYQGCDSTEHRWQGTMSQDGKPHADKD